MRRARRAAGLLGALLLMGCDPIDPRTASTPRVVAFGDAGEAPAALQRYGCAHCHLIPGIRGADALVGPPLAAYSRRSFIAGRVANQPDHLVRFIMNPQAVKPGSAMPVLGITEKDARDIAAYLYTLR